MQIKSHYIKGTGFDSRKPEVITTTPEILYGADRSKISKTQFEIMLPERAFTDFYYSSLFAQILGDNLNLNSMIENISIDETLVVTLKTDVLGDFADSQCEEWDFDEVGNFAFELKGGAIFRFSLKECLPCPGGGCGQDWYDLATISTNSIMANRAFAKAFDYLIFTGKNLKTGTKVQNFVSAFEGAVKSPFIANSTNSVQDLELTLMGLIETYETAVFDYTTGATGTAGQADYKYSRTNQLLGRSPQDFIIFISHEMKNKIQLHPAINGQVAEGYMTIANGYGVRKLGLWDGMFQVIEVPKILIGGNDAFIFDKKSYVAVVNCEEEQYFAKGHDYKNMKATRYAKQWVFKSGRIAPFGNHSMFIPARSLADETLVYKTPVTVTGTPAVTATVTNTAADPVNVKTITTP